MKIYVAVRFHEREKVKEIYKLLQEKGHELSADWTWHINSKPYSDNPKRSQGYSIEDMDGVKNCDVFILLTNELTGAGTSAELGGAIMSRLLAGKPKVYVVGKHIGNNMFYFHPSVNIRKTVQEVLEELK